MEVTLYTPTVPTTENPDLFSSFEPKLEAYRAKLAAGVLDEYKLPDNLVPQDDGDVTGIPDNILNDAEKTITETSAVYLAASIANGKLTAVEVLKAFAKRATAAHQLTNCAMDLFIPEALERAAELDEYYKTTGKTVGPLHGLPISLKERFDVKGRITHAGYVCAIDNVSKDWSLIPKKLWDAGAVFFIRTCQPQTLMHLCTNNNITGICRNPYNTRLTSGGSSSGEAALTAMHGSAFGIGSDGGGSIRAPAAFCGVWGIRCTQKRLPLRGNSVSSATGVNDCFHTVNGPLARSADDLELALKVLSDKAWEDDATLIPLPWRTVSKPKVSDLTIAVCYDDGVVKPMEPIIRGLKYVAGKLKAAGATVVEWKPNNVDLVSKLSFTVYSANGNAGQKKLFEKSGEPILKSSVDTLSFGFGDRPLTYLEYEKICKLRDENMNLYREQMKGIDFLLTPAYCNVAPVPETLKYWAYTSIWNFLDQPGVVFPTGLRMDPELDAPKEYHPRSDIEAYERSLYKDPSVFDGAPICVQLIGRRWFCEEVLQGAKAISEIL